MEYWRMDPKWKSPKKPLIQSPALDGMIKGSEVLKEVPEGLIIQLKTYAHRFLTEISTLFLK